ncbi:hypothetical protein [Subtercola vilae]|uniref:Uncharacterized protein n=1 Tax=Subtercola vilae TaxID=2056433 RepID=A0A4T2BDN2_9MICO|nr:hypothetical protein [Subtercola vilae]TIH28609.1 hypothetical protein D4765_18440 [Subtercola vilae]
MSDTFPDEARHSEEAYEAIRQVGDGQTSSLPAPWAYDVIGNLMNASLQLPRAFKHLSNGLAISLTQFEMVEEDGADPLKRNAAARAHLAQAGELAKQLAAELEAAQSAISQQVYARPRRMRP